MRLALLLVALSATAAVLAKAELSGEGESPSFLANYSNMQPT